MSNKAQADNQEQTAKSLERRLRRPAGQLGRAGILLDISGTNADALDDLVSLTGWEHAFDVLVDAFGNDDLPMMESVRGARCLSPDSHRGDGNSPRKVAIYYLTLGTGGGERITIDVAMSWRDMGYDVLLLCDESRMSGVTDLGPGITIVGLPDCQSEDRKVWHERGRALHDALREHEAEALVYSYWLGSSMGRDMLATQMAGTRFFLFNHGTSRCTSGYGEPGYLRIPALLRHADGIVCLSEEDRTFFNAFNGNVTVVPNKISASFLSQPEPALTGNRIVWVGRVSWDKSPLDALDMLVSVQSQVPDATLSMVGPFRSFSEEQMRDEARRRNIEDAVIFVGDVSHEDLPGLLRQFDLAVFTSHLEGYLVALAEVQALGLPVAMYDMDYLPLLDGYRGMRVAPIGDTQGLADRCVEILLDKELARSLGEEGSRHVREIQSFDMERAWEGLFEGDGRARSKLEGHAAVGSTLWEASREEHRLRDVVSNLESRCRQTEHDLRMVTASKSFLLGRALTFPLRKARDVIASIRR